MTQRTLFFRFLCLLLHPTTRIIEHHMDITDLKPRTGADCLRLADSDDLVVMENFGGMPAGRVRPMDHGIIIICTAGAAQFEYNGQTVQLNKNDLFLYMVRSVVEKFMSTPDFNCRQIWFSRGELWNMNMYVKNSLADVLPLKLNPKVALSNADVSLFDAYFQQLCHHMRNSSQVLYPEIVRSIVGTLLLEVLSVLRRDLHKLNNESSTTMNSGLHGKKLAERFLQLVEQSDGRIRRVDEFAQMLNVTPKYLSKLLMDTMKLRPSDMVAFYTLQAIENRLRYTDMTMQQIADDLNFANPSFFGKYFKEHSGMTPMEFRTKYHQEEKK